MGKVVNKFEYSSKYLQYFYYRTGQKYIFIATEKVYANAEANNLTPIAAFALIWCVSISQVVDEQQPFLFRKSA